MNNLLNPWLLATPVSVQVSFLSHWSGAPETNR
jgi:hypothetical protein